MDSSIEVESIEVLYFLSSTVGLSLEAANRKGNGKVFTSLCFNLTVWLTIREIKSYVFYNRFLMTYFTFLGSHMMVEASKKQGQLTYGLLYYIQSSMVFSTKD